MNKIGSGTKFEGKMGLGSYIDKNSCLSAYIGRFCSIASNVSFVSATHPYTFPFATTSPAFFSIDKQCGDTFATEQKFCEWRYYDAANKIAVKIGNDCWIGEEVLFVGGKYR